ncbi:MAG: 3-isopropylmalate dehydrogenase [Pseudomonadota bacterium]|nr:3-isopropylmalate dehydrogenase [Pseudomonadota bacterium]
MTKRILVLPGDGIGPEIVGQAVKVLEALAEKYALDVDLEHGLIGGIAYDELGSPLPERTLELARSADAVLLGAVGGEKWDTLPRDSRPETGLLRIRAELGLFSNLRPAILYPELAQASTLRADVVSDLDILIVRELTGGVYFGQPRGIRTREDGQREGFNTMRYSESEIARIVRSAAEIAMRRGKRLCSVDKANVLDVSGLWRDVATEVIQTEYPEVELSHMYVDNAAMQLVRAPKQFDVMVTSNLFGDVLSDIAAMLTGSIGMLPSASLNESSQGLYEPVHGSAPDIAGQDKANPLATILSLAMMLRYSLNEPAMADRVETAVRDVLAKGLRTADIAQGDDTVIGTQAMGEAVVAAL